MVTTDFSNDLYLFDVSEGIWSNLSGIVAGSKPAPRVFFGFASSGGKLYLFGGLQGSGEARANFSDASLKLPLGRLPVSFDLQGSAMTCMRWTSPR